MKTQNRELYSGIRQHLKSQVLRRGSWLATCGIVLWVLGGVLLSPATLSYWGAPLFLLGGALIALGMVPYRRLTALESHPHRLIIEPDAALHFWHKGKPLLTIPLSVIHRIDYRDDASLYGIQLWVKPEAVVQVHRPTIDAASYIQEVQRRHGCDIFLPYFGKSAYGEVEDALAPVDNAP